MPAATDVQNLFNGKAHSWPGKYRSGGSLAPRVEQFAARVSDFCPRAGSILDLGCGTGEIAAAIARRGYGVTACDIAEDMLQVARRRWARMPVGWLSLRQDWTALPFEDSSFDGIVASSVFEYLADLDGVVRELARVLRPGGILVFSVPNPCNRIRKVERLFRSRFILRAVRPWAGRIRGAKPYLAYLQLSRNRFGALQWESILNAAGFEAVDESQLSEASWQRQASAPLVLVTVKRVQRGDLHAVEIELIRQMPSSAVLEQTERAPSRDGGITLPEFASGLKPPSVGTYWRTLRHLQGSQMFWLVRHRVWQGVWRGPRPSVQVAAAPVRLKSLCEPAVFAEWQPARARRMIESGEFDLLNAACDGTNGMPWTSSALSRLGLYHLNYCDFLNLDLTQPLDRPVLRKALRLMLDWHRQNSTGREVGWEPYPLSLRVVNWLKFLLRNGRYLEVVDEKIAVAEILFSLRLQVCALEKALEFHLRANHLLKNLKALMFAGALLETRESNRWWNKGAKLLAGQLEEQILPDGGHFERSPMYHAEVLDDLLDLQTLTSASGRPLACAPLLSESIDRMADFLEAVLHPDGEIPLFNDSAFGMSPASRDLLLRAGRLSTACGRAGNAVTILPETGYAVMREPRSKSCLIFDCGAVGPDFQPGHAHCDVLSYELSLDGQRVVVDTGVSTYEPGPERHYERSTAAHNTLRIDGEEQAEIWASFRVGRRPKVRPMDSGQVKRYAFMRGLHQAYRRLGVVHARQIILCPGNCWVVIDSLEGGGWHRVESFIHFHPGVQVGACTEGERSFAGDLRKRFLLSFASHRYFLLSSEAGNFALKEAWYSPEFGRRQKQTVCCWAWQGFLPSQLVYALVPAGRRIPRAFLQSDQKFIAIDDVRIPLR